MEAVMNDQRKTKAQLIKELEQTRGRIAELVPKQADEALQKAHDELEQRVEERTAKLQAAVETLNHEIAERQRAEKALRESEERYRKLFEEARDGIFLADAETGVIVDCNRAAAELVGRDKSELIGQHQKILHPPREVKGRFTESFKKHLEDSEGQVLEEQVITSSGEIKEVAIKANFLNVGGRKLLQGMFRDITGRKRAEEALRTEHDKLKQIFEAMDDGIYIVNQDYDIEYVNPVLIADFGPYEGRKCYAYFHEREEVCPWCKNQDVFAGKTVRWEWYSFKNRKTYDLIDTPLRNIDGTISKLEIFRDITDRKRLEAEMLRSAKLESLGVMAGGLAHDFNNFLASIMLNVGTARLKAGKGEEISALLQAAEQSIQKAKGITQQLLAFTRDGEPVKSSRSLPPLIKESVKFTLHGSKTIPRFDLPDDLWPAEIDPGQINQVINSLAVNAMQAMPRGGYLAVTGRNVTIGKGDPRTALQPGNYVEVVFKDDGPAIPPESLDSIFDPYLSIREGGTGLGLFSVHSIIERHGGWITVESNVDRGTTFTFCLPAAAREVEVPSSGVIQKGSGLVLVMDDDDMIRLGMTALLGELGYDVETTADGEEAIERYGEALKSDRPFDAVILDLTIPGGMGGAETIERLKELDPRVRAVVASGYSTDPIMANYREYGFKAVLPKPFQPAELSRAMDQVLG